MVEKTFDLDETAIVTCQINDTVTGDLVDPDTVKITIEINGIKKVDNQGMGKDSTGNYHYDYTPDGIGRYDVTIKAVQVGISRTTIQKTTFLVT